jgi:hypothetical protein
MNTGAFLTELRMGNDGMKVKGKKQDKEKKEDSRETAT